MNLENLKSEWSAMNDRMEKREILEEKMFCQMLNAKSDKSLNRLVAYEVAGLIFGVLFVPVLFYCFNSIELGFERTVIIGAIVFLAICVIWIGIKIFALSKIDFSKSLKNNLFYVNKFAIYIKYERLIGYYFVIPLAGLICVIHYTKIHASLFWWVLMSCFLTTMIIFVIFFYRLYSKNISTIQQNLEELRELEEK
jgi:hypothetical protein